MPRKGGYGRSEPVEWVKLSQISYAEAITTAAKMSQDVQTWFADAVSHHVYRCELLQAKERYQVDEVAAASAARPTPDKLDPRYSVNRPRPTITRPQGATGPGNAPRPAPGGRRTSK
jgi:hypothetical protein